MRTALVTGGAGFIGRWVAKALLDEGWAVLAFDDFSAGSPDNVDELAGSPGFELLEGSVADERSLDRAFRARPDLCLHLAARINVQRSIDDPAGTFRPDVGGTLLVAEGCRRVGTPLLFMSTCMVYAPARAKPIAETHPVLPASPYAAGKLACEYLALSYGLAYGHPVTVVRPFNTYGPFQRSDGEGGVVSIFCARALAGETIEVFGDGTQTRDLLYVEDCAEFVLRAALSERARGHVVNAGTGRETVIRELADVIGIGRAAIRHVAHPHPQAEIPRLVCDTRKAERLLGWRPATSLEEGIAQTRTWLEGRVAAAR